MPKIAAACRLPPAAQIIPSRAPMMLPLPGGPRAAEVGSEMVRYCQRLRLLAVPHSAGGVRYPSAVIDRIRFIKPSRNLSLALDEIRALMRLGQGGAAPSSN